MAAHAIVVNARSIRRMKKFVESLFGLREGERGLALMMFLYHYLLLITLYLLKPIRDSIFLTERGAPELPIVFMMTSLAVIPTAMLYTRAGRKLRMGWLVNGTTLVLVGSLLGVRWLLGIEESVGGWVYYLLYVWVSIYGVLITSQFWLFANAVFDSAQAKRVFAMLSLGAIAGAVTGGELTGLLVEGDIMNSANLLYIAAAILGVSIFVVNAIRARVLEKRSDVIERRGSEDEPMGLLGIFDILRGSRHLLLIVGIISLAVLTTTMVDFQFKSIAARLLDSGDDLTTFMGRFYSRVSVIALLFQIVLAPKLIRMLGAGGSLLILPLGLILGSAAFFFVPSLTAGTALRGVDQSLRHSIDRTGRELLFLPISLEVKKRVKVFIDLFMDHGASGLGGLLLLILTVGLNMDLREISLVMLGLLAVWIGLVLLARHSYVEEFRDSIEEQVDAEEEEPEEERVGAQTVTEEDFERVLERALSSSQPQEILRALRQLEESNDRVPVSSVQRLLGHGDAEVRRRAIRVLRTRNIGEMVEPVTKHLQDVASEVRLEAARYLYRNLNGERLPLLERGLAHPDVRVRTMVVGLIAKEGGPRAYGMLSDQLMLNLADLEGDQAEEARLQVARALGVIERPALDDLLGRLLKDPSPAVRKRALESVGKRGTRRFFHVLLDHLKDDTYQQVAGVAIAAFGDRILGTVYDYLTDPKEDEEIRTRLPGAIVGHESQSTVEVLLTALKESTVPVRHAIILALSRLRSNNRKLRFKWDLLREEVREEARHYAAVGQIYNLWRKNDVAAGDVFDTEVFAQARRRSLENIFRLLSLYYLQDDMMNAFRGLVSERKDLRAGALEFVDNLLDWETKRFLLPILDDPEGEQAAKKASDTFDLQLTRWTEAIAYLIRVDDPLLNVRAIRIARQMNEPALESHIEAARQHPHPAVRQAALRPLDKG